ncbi:MAG: hypothetical protein KAT34_20900, partial [Candidatus Aminicenantes bacterium]|nr:hypothetical protein [Candidatus Aminicenantes bacterium]
IAILMPKLSNQHIFFVRRDIQWFPARNRGQGKKRNPATNIYENRRQFRSFLFIIGYTAN